MISDHTSEVAADLREIFAVSLWDVGILELSLLLVALAKDPRSRFQAAHAGWAHPVSREWMVIADLYDLEHQKAMRKGRTAKPIPRPWPDKNVTTLGKNRRRRTIREVRAILRPDL